MPFGSFANVFRVEIGAFEKNRRGFFRYARIGAPENTGNAHAFLFVAYHQVVHVQLALHIVEGDKGRLAGHFLHHHLVAFYFGRIKSVQRMPRFVQHEIGDVHHVVNGPHANAFQFQLKPFRRLFHGNVFHRYAGITRAGLGVFHHNFNVKVVVVHFKFRNIRKFQFVFPGVKIAVEPGHQVACRADMRGGIPAVRGEADFVNPVFFYLEKFGCRRARYGFAGQYHNTVVRAAQPQFVFGTNHPFRYFAPDFGLFNLKRIIAVVQGGSYGGHHHFLALGHIGRPAHNGQNLSAYIHRSHAQLVGIGVLFTGQHLANHHAFQSAFHRLKFFKTFHFQSDIRKDSRQFQRFHIQVNIIF